jgi:hypothetical protein
VDHSGRNPDRLTARQAFPISAQIWQPRLEALGRTPEEIEETLELYASKGKMPHSAFATMDGMAVKGFPKRTEYGTRPFSDPELRSILAGNLPPGVVDHLSEAELESLADRIEACQLPSRSGYSKPMLLNPREQMALVISQVGPCAISAKDYAAELRLFELMGCDDAGDGYMDYCLNDSGGSLDCVFNFAAMTKDKLGLDMNKYVSMPQMVKAACFKGIQEAGGRGPAHICTGQEDIMEMAEQATVGGLSMAPHDTAFANHKHLGEELFDKYSHKRYLMYYDVNSLYPFVMLGYLPYDDYERIFGAEAWAAYELLKERILLGKKDFSEEAKGQLFYIKAHFPEEKLTPALREFPPFIERRSITEEMLGSQMRQRSKDLGLKHDPTPRIIAHGMEVDHYAISGDRLQLLVERGCVVTEVYEAIQFTQAPFLRDFVMLCYRERFEADATGDEMMSIFWKTCVNSLYGKMLENKRKHRECTLFADYVKNRDREVSKDGFAGVEKIGNCYAINRPKTQVVLDVPMLVGVMILEKSKAYMQRVFWELCDAYKPGAVKLNVMDTDSLLVSVETEDYFRDLMQCKTPAMQQWRRRLDLSAFAKLPEGDERRKLAVHPDLAYFASLPKSDPRHAITAAGTTAKFPGFLKDELFKNGAMRYMYQLAGVRAKMYSYDVVTEEHEIEAGGTRAKGVPLVKHFVTSKPLTEVYLDVVESGIAAARMEVNGIRSKDFELRSFSGTKSTIVPFDCKFDRDEFGEKMPWGWRQAAAVAC